MSDWSNVKNLLCIRPDNMGDLLMSGPAMRTLKHALGAKITVLTSSMAALIAQFMPEIDEVITFDVPWVKANAINGRDEITLLIDQIKKRNFDAAVIFTVFSQTPFPSAMLAYQAGIPRVLAYARENPYRLITDWQPDNEPFDFISHQVTRDLRLVTRVCAPAQDIDLKLRADDNLWTPVQEILTGQGLDFEKPWLILHPGVSEAKRMLPTEIWIDAAKQLISSGYQILLTGSPGEKQLTNSLKNHIGHGAVDTAGMLSIGQLITLISHSALLLSVNTGTVHIAAAVKTPVVVLYAQTNPQHTPWMVPHVVIEFPVPDDLKSKNEIIRQVDQTVYAEPAVMPAAETIVTAVASLIKPPAASDQPFREKPYENPARVTS